MPAKSKPTPQPDNWSYETTVGAIETIIAQLETGNLPLEEVLSQFEDAVKSLQQCETYLASKRQQVDLLIETLESPE